MENYIMIFEDDIFIADNYSDEDITALNDGILSIIRITDCKELDFEGNWVKLKKWEN